MPYTLGASSQAHLDGVHPHLVAVVHAAIKITAQDFTVAQGLRSAAEERKHVADGTSRTMHSMHLKQPDGYGHAVGGSALTASTSLSTSHVSQLLATPKLVDGTSSPIQVQAHVSSVSGSPTGRKFQACYVNMD